MTAPTVEVGPVLRPSDQLLDAVMDLVDAASATSAAVTELVANTMAADPAGATAALAALRGLGAAQTHVLGLVDQAGQWATPERSAGPPAGSDSTSARTTP